MCLLNAYLVYLQYDSPSKQISYGYVYSYRINAVFFSLVAHDNSVSIYGAVVLPVDYRGSFYAIGKDSVGAKLVYVKYRRRYRFVKLCELLRKGFCVEDDEEQLIPDSHSSENDEAKDETEVENEM